MTSSDQLDLIIIGGGIGGVISLKYALSAGLSAVLLERKDGVGGIWRDLPGWQDIQFRKEEWTLGDLPIAGENQAAILANIQAWVDRFELSPWIRCNAEVTSARPVTGGWEVGAGGATHRGRYLIAATGGHNRPVVPEVERRAPKVRELHSSALADPEELAGRTVLVVGGGASAYDLLDLSFEHGARKVVWAYRSTKWMRPTRKAKYFGTDLRELSKRQMLGVPISKLNRVINRDLRERYRKSGLAEIQPPGDFDLRRHQLIPGRRGMIARFAEIERHPGEVRSIADRTVHFTDGSSVECDLVLWATGYDVDQRYFGVDRLARTTRLEELARRCGMRFLSLDAPNLFFLAPGVLEASTATPWAYAHVARSIMSHIRGSSSFTTEPESANINYFDLVKRLARHDHAGYTPWLWRLRYLREALFYPRDRPLPIP